MATETQLLTEEWTNDDINTISLFFFKFFKLPLYMYQKNWSHPLPGFIQASLGKIQGLFKTSNGYPTVFKD